MDAQRTIYLVDPTREESLDLVRLLGADKRLEVLAFRRLSETLAGLCEAGGAKRELETLTNIQLAFHSQKGSGRPPI